MSNMNIFKRITLVFLLNFPITYAGGDYKNDFYGSDLISVGYILLVRSNIYPIGLQYPLRPSLLAEFYENFIFLSKAYFFGLK
jgi:hypothetical protein